MVTESIWSKAQVTVSEILFYIWDPIGVNRNLSCRDEYDIYVPIITAYLINRYPQSSVDALLRFIMEECIGVRLAKPARRKAQHLQAMNMLMQWQSRFMSICSQVGSNSPKFPIDGSFMEQLEWSLSCSKR